MNIPEEESRCLSPLGFQTPNVEHFICLVVLKEGSESCCDGVITSEQHLVQNMLGLEHGAGMNEVGRERDALGAHMAHICKGCGQFPCSGEVVVVGGSASRVGVCGGSLRAKVTDGQGKRLDAFGEVIIICPAESEAHEFLDKFGSDNGDLVHRARGTCDCLIGNMFALS